MADTVSEVTIRPVASDEEIVQAYQIHQQVVPSPWRYPTFADCTGTPYSMLVCGPSPLLGYAILLMVVDEATLMDIGIAPHNQGLGHGKQLLEAAIQHAISRQMATLWLEVRESNKVAQNLYKQKGFVISEVRKKYYPTADGFEDAVIMQLPLD